MGKIGLKKPTDLQAVYLNVMRICNEMKELMAQIDMIQLLLQKNKIRRDLELKVIIPVHISEGQATLS